MVGPGIPKPTACSQRSKRNDTLGVTSLGLLFKISVELSVFGRGSFDGAGSDFVLSCSFPWAAPLPFDHSIQQACRQQARATDTSLSHAAPPLPPRHPTYHHQLGAPGASENPQALEPELSATRTSPPALGCSLLQGGEVHVKASVTSQWDVFGWSFCTLFQKFRNTESQAFLSDEKNTERLL